MNKEKLKTHLLTSGRATFYREAGYWGASLGKFFGFGKSGDEALDALIDEICKTKETLDQLETSIEIDHCITQRMIGNCTVQ